MYTQALLEIDVYTGFSRDLPSLLEICPLVLMEKCSRALMEIYTPILLDSDTPALEICMQALLEFCTQALLEIGTPAMLLSYARDLCTISAKCITVMPVLLKISMPGFMEI